MDREGMRERENKVEMGKGCEWEKEGFGKEGDWWLQGLRKKGNEREGKRERKAVGVGNSVCVLRAHLMVGRVGVTP